MLVLLLPLLFWVRIALGCTGDISVDVFHRNEGYHDCRLHRAQAVLSELPRQLRGECGASSGSDERRQCLARASPVCGAEASEYALVPTPAAVALPWSTALDSTASAQQ